MLPMQQSPQSTARRCPGAALSPCIAHMRAASAPLPDDQSLHARRRLLWLAAGIACFATLLAFQQYPWITERAYATTVSPLVVQLLSRITGITPVPLFELVIILIVGRLLVAAALALRQVRRRTRRLSNALLGGLLRVAGTTGALLAAFYIIWGFNYVRPRLDARLGYGASAPRASGAELARLTRQLVDAAESAYVELHGRTDAGTPTAMPADQRQLIAALDSGWRRTTAELHLPDNSARRYGRPKFPISSSLARHIGISAGMFFPYTGEALVIGDLPAPQLVKTMAHEQAHQRGTAVEGDANALAFFVCAWAPDPLARYAGLSFARDQMLGELARVDPGAFRAVWLRMGPGVQRDRQALRDYWRRTRVPSSELANRVNDASLRMNRVAEGVRSYSRSTLIFIEFARRRGGFVVPDINQHPRSVP